MLQTSKDLLDLISDTGSKEDIDFLKENSWKCKCN